MTKPRLIEGLKAEREAIASEIDRLLAALEHLDAAIETLSERSQLRLPSPLKGVGLLPRGSIVRHVFDALRTSQKPLTTRDIGIYVATQHGLDTSNNQIIAAAINRVGKAMAYYRKNGHVLGERRGNMTWWRLP